MRTVLFPALRLLAAIFLVMTGLLLPKGGNTQAYVPLQVTGLSFSDSSPYSGWHVTGTLYFNKPAYNASVGINSTGPFGADSSVMNINNGQLSFDFDAQGVVRHDTTMTVTAAMRDPVTNFPSSVSTSVTVQAIHVSSVSFASPAVLSGQPTTATVTLSHATYAGSWLSIGGPGQFYKTIAPKQNSVTFTFTDASVGTHTLTAMADESSCAETGTAVGTYYVTADTKSPAPGSPPLPTPQKCLMCSGDLTGGIDMYTGNGKMRKSDPVATRGYPLVCNIHVNSQVVEALRPMGNATFTYDIHLAMQSLYGSNCVGTQHWIVVDGDGTRLDFGLASGAPAATAGIFSKLVAIAGGYQLQGAGPPEALATSRIRSTA